MSIDYCAGLLRTGDPDRFASVLAARPADRPKLATLYAANLDIARAATASAEPLISQMRLQFWADQLDAIRLGRMVQPHDIFAILAQVWGPDIAPLADVVAARQRDTQRIPVGSQNELCDYIDATSGTVMALAGRACGYEGEIIAHQARGAGIARWLAAYPQLRALNLGLADDDLARLADVARIGIASFDRACTIRPRPPRRAAAALFAGAGARRTLLSVIAGKESVPNEFSRRTSYAALAVLGRWQA